MVKTARPVDCNVALLAVQPRSTFHTSTGADSAELEQTIKDWTIITNVIAALLFDVAVDVIRGDLLKEVDVFIGMELRHFVFGRWFRAL